MTLQTFSVNETPPASKMNSLSRQAVIVCTLATRPSSPDEGMHVYCTDVNLAYWWDGSAWKSIPRGIVTKTTLTATGPGIGGTFATVNNSPLTTTMIANEYYAYEVDLTIMTTVAGDIFNIKPQLDGSDIDAQRIVYIPVAGVAFPVSLRVIQSVGTTANHTFSLVVGRSSGTGTGSAPAGTDCTLSHVGGP